MDPITALLALAALLFVGAFVAQPFFSPRGADAPVRGDQRAASTLRERLAERAELLAERNRVYAAIRDLDFDFKTNKVADEEYAEQRYRLVAQGVEILERLDTLPANGASSATDPLEALIAAYRAGEPVSADASATPAAFCPQCGTRAKPGDRFCGACGARL